MSAETQELVDICERLPDTERTTVTAFARFLLSQIDGGEGEGEGDAAWERIIADPRPRPKLEAFMAESAKEGTEPLDLERMADMASRP